MDIVYASQARDIGVLKSYTFDLAFGENENDFAVTIPLKDRCCDPGYIIYAEDTEIGGIIDAYTIDTKAQTMTYSGRTWHGILAGKIIAPPAGEGYLVAKGDANAVIGDLTQMIGLTDLFEADSSQAGVDVSYRFDRYIDAYAGMRKMLRAYGLKLRLVYENKKVKISAVPRSAYIWGGDVDSSQITIRATHKHRPTNHIICLGSGNLSERAVIHLFTDENGGVQPYASAAPAQDSDYITDERQKVLTGEDEVVEVLDYPSAGATTNWIALTEEPSDWETSYKNYYQATDDGYAPISRRDVTIYRMLRREPPDWEYQCTNYYTKSGDAYTRVTTTESYTALTAEPSDWDEGYGDYYIRASGGQYSRVAGVNTTTYVAQAKKPQDWDKNWSAYYYQFTDGVSTGYRMVEGVEHVRYAAQTVRPTDWETQATQYYRAKKTGGYEHVEMIGGLAPAWRPRTYYTRQTYDVAPAWESGAYYSRVTAVEAPAWTSGTYYVRNDDVAPTWSAGTYYSKSEKEKAPGFVQGAFFRAVEDRYATLVDAGTERLRQAWEADEATIESSGQTYDVGDIVGVSDHISGASLVQEVVEKIVRITNGTVSEEYTMR